MQDMNQSEATAIHTTIDDSVEISKDKLKEIEEAQQLEVAKLEADNVDLLRSALEYHMGKSLDEIKTEDKMIVSEQNKKAISEEKFKKYQKPQKHMQQASLLVPKQRIAGSYIQNLIHNLRERNDSEGIDGQDHINIAEKARTSLGRFLDINTRTPFEHPDLGHFESIGGLWYFIKVEDSREGFRKTYGRSNRILGKEHRQRQVEGFPIIIADATWIKILSNPGMAANLAKCTLPFKNYFLYGALNTVRHTPESYWYCAVINECRATLKKRAAAIAAGNPDTDMIQPDFSFLVEERTVNT